MAASGVPVRQLRRGPAPIASFDHDVSDESSPETKQTFRLPEIREDPASTASAALAPPEQRARSHSTPAVAAGLHTPAAPRIDISRASSSSHHDSRDSSPELALFAGTGSDDTRGRLELGFREDGALELRSSTEELAFLEGAPGETRAPAQPPPQAPRHHSRKDSQGSETALLAVSGRTSRLSSIGSQCSAHSALSAFSHQSRASVGRLSVVSGISRSPSPHRMLLETSFCGPKPIETDPEICAAAVEERLLEIAKMSASSSSGVTPQAVDARDRREVRTEATVEPPAARTPPPASRAPPPASRAPPPASRAPPPASRAPPPAPPPAPVASPPATKPAPPAAPLSVPATSPEAAACPAVSVAPVPVVSSTIDDDKLQKETQNRARVQERRARPRVRREPSEPEVYKSANRSKDIIRIKLKPEDDYDEEDNEISRSTDAEACRPAPLELVGRAARPTALVGRASPAALVGRASPAAPASPDARRSPSPAGVTVSRKSSFCSLFKSRETIASPDSPSDALRRKRSLTDGRSRSKSRDRSATPSSAGKIRGSVLSLFRTPRKSAASPSPSSREGSPVVQPQRQIVAVSSQSSDRTRRSDKLKYYEDTKDGIIHIPLRTPPDEQLSSSSARGDPETNKTSAEVTTQREPPRPASAPQSRPQSDREFAPSFNQKPIHRTVLPDGSIIIPLRSPTERPSEDHMPSPPISISSPPNTAPPIDVETDKSTPSDVPVTIPTPPRDNEDCVTVPDTEGIEPAQTVDEGQKRRKERLIFTTHVGSREQVFSTQLSITKTPSVTSEISGSFPSFVDGDEVRSTTTRNAIAPPADTRPANTSPQEPPRDSSESEPSSESAPPLTGDEVEKRGLVVQQSFEEELPYVPTTLPQERSVALPMVPVRDRGGVLVSGVSRPRGSLPGAPVPAASRPHGSLPGAPVQAASRPHGSLAGAPVSAVSRPRGSLPGGAAPRAAPPPAPPAAAADKLRIRLPRRPSTAAPTTKRPDRPRTRSGSDSFDFRPKSEWIDFEEVPERRKQPKRIQTLPAAAAAAAGEGTGAAGVVFSYVEPEQCRCECHAHAHAASRDHALLPLLHHDVHAMRLSSASPSPECGAGGAGVAGGEVGVSPPSVQLGVHEAPFTADLDLHPDSHADGESRSH